MNIVTPNFTELRSGAGKFFSSLGVLPTIFLVIAVLAILFYAGGGALDWFQGWRANRQVEKLQEEAEQWKAQAETEKAAKEQAIGAAAAYKQEAEAQNQVLVELLNERPELQNKVNAAARKVEAARSSSLQPIDSHIRERVDALGAELDKLYPDK